ncbi:MAG: hypothetical protein ACXQT4_00755, partial [Methanotrichaceae archaeon]
VIAPCVATAPDFSICQGTELDDTIFTDAGASCSEGCDISLDSSLVNTLIPGLCPYSVTCTNDICGSTEAWGTVNVTPS